MDLHPTKLRLRKQPQWLWPRPCPEKLGRLFTWKFNRKSPKGSRIVFHSHPFLQGLLLLNFGEVGWLDYHPNLQYVMLLFGPCWQCWDRCTLRVWKLSLWANGGCPYFCAVFCWATSSTLNQTPHMAQSNASNNSFSNNRSCIENKPLSIWELSICHVYIPHFCLPGDSGSTESFAWIWEIIYMYIQILSFLTQNNSIQNHR